MSDNEVSQPSLGSRVVRGTIWVALGSYSNIIIGFLANLILTRLLAPDQFGIFSYATFFFSVLNLRAWVPVGIGFARKKENSPELLGTFATLNMVGALAAIAVSLLVAPALLYFEKPPAVVQTMLALAFIGLVAAFSEIAEALLDKELIFSRTSLVRTIAFPLSYIPAIWLATRGAGVWSLVASNAALATLVMAGCWIMARRQLPHLWKDRWRYNQEIARYIIRYGLSVGLASLAVTVSSQFDNFLIGTFAGLDTLGYYDRAYRIALWPTLLVSGIVSKTAFYTYAKIQDDKDRLTRTVTMTLWIIATIGLPLAIAIFISAPDLIRLLYGDKWLPSTIFLRFLVVIAILQPLFGDIGAFYVATGHSKLNAITSIVQAVTMVCVGILLTIRFSALGTCVAVAISFSVGLALTYYYLKKMIDVPLWDTLAMPLITAILTITGYLIWVRVVNITTWPIFWQVLVKGAYAGVTYLGLVFLFQPQKTATKILYLRQLLVMK